MASSLTGRSLMAKPLAELLAPDRPLILANVADGAEGMVIADLARSIAAGSLTRSLGMRSQAKLNWQARRFEFW